MKIVNYCEINGENFVTPLKVDPDDFDFHRLDVDDRLDLLVQEMIREKRAEFKPGVGKFEAILEEINLSGQVDDDTRKKLYELSKARNVLVHRAGIVDIKLLEDCPWLDYEVGKPLIIDREKYSKYLTAVIAYLTLLIKRVRKLHGLSEGGV